MSAFNRKRVRRAKEIQLLGEAKVMGTGDINATCCACKRILLRGLDENNPPKAYRGEPLFTVCFKCGAQNAVPFEWLPLL